ncbi:MAG: DMT family transporter [Acidiferrobacter sp.]
MRTHPPLSLILATVVVLAGMAANSLLARGVLVGHWIGPALFTAVRLASGAFILLLLLALRGQRLGRPPRTALFLLVYAAAFSYTYLVLGAAMGALLLFFAVQATMLGVAVYRGERLTSLQMAGAVIAFAGLYVLVAVRLHRPPAWDVVGMLLAGGAWGLYSMGGGGKTGALAQTTANFAYAALGGLILLAWSWMTGHHHPATPLGLGGAVISGSLTSSLIYLLWYAIVPRLATAVAATVQLAVPLFVAAGAWLFLAEPLTGRFVAAATLSLTGIALTMRKSQAAGTRIGQ